MTVRFVDDAPRDPRLTAKERLKATATDLVGALVQAWTNSKSAAKGCGVCGKERAKLKAGA
jgi:hypothetical protein